MVNNQWDEYIGQGKTMSGLGFGTKDEREAILKLWDQKQDTWQIGRLLGREENYIERQLHLALEIRRGIRSVHS